MEQRAARVAFRRSQAVLLGVSLSLFALLVGGMLFAFGVWGGDNTSAPIIAPIAWLLAVAAPIVGAAASVRTRMTRPLQIGVGVSTASLIVVFLAIRAAST